MTDELSIKLIGEEWSRKLRTMMFSPEFEALGKFIASQRMKYTVYPKQEDVFKAFRLTPFNSVKIVILGQDPYHDEGSATGLAFANPSKRVVPSPSLRQILREVENDCYEGFDFEHFTDLNLESWAKQGVLLLNTALTVQAGKPDSHIAEWKFFTNTVLTVLNGLHSGLIFMLWGNYAKSYKGKILSPVQHHILEAGHPATVCYGNDTFSGCKHFSKANEILERCNGKNARINW